MVGLMLDPKKSQMMEFNKTDFVDKDMQINVDGETILNTEARFLSILLDYYLIKLFFFMITN